MKSKQRNNRRNNQQVAPAPTGKANGSAVSPAAPAAPAPASTAPAPAAPTPAPAPKAKTDPDLFEEQVKGIVGAMLDERDEALRKEIGKIVNEALDERLGNPDAQPAPAPTPTPASEPAPAPQTEPAPAATDLVVHQVFRRFENGKPCYLASIFDADQAWGRGSAVAVRAWCDPVTGAVVRELTAAEMRAHFGI